MTTTGAKKDVVVVDHLLPPSPFTHAISGSLGSAIALILLYPLERTRTELQAAASSATTIKHDDDDHENDDDDNNEQITPTPENNQLLMSESSLHNEGSQSSSDSWITCSPTKNAATTEGKQSTAEETKESSSSGEERQPSKTQQQEGTIGCMKRLYKEGVLYRGIGPVVQTMALSNLVFFYANEFMKHLLMNDDQGRRRRRNIGKSLLASCCAGIINVLLTNPLWVANIRIVQSKNKGESSSSSSSLFQEVTSVAMQEGVASLWNGTWVSLLLVSNPVIQFVVYEQLKEARRTRTRRNNSSSLGRFTPLESFVAGAIAKAIATVLTYPLQLSQVLLRLQRKKQQPSLSLQPMYDGTLDCLMQLVRNKGLLALFAGLKPKLLQTVLTSAFTFLSYEQILHVVHQSLTTPVSQ